MKTIMEDEAKNIELSQGLRDRILKARKKTLRDKIRDFLNMEVELPLVPMMAGFLLLFIMIGVPKDLMELNKTTKVVEIGSSQMIIRDERRLSRND